MNTALVSGVDPDDWATPEGFFSYVSGLVGGCDLDACATDKNAKCDAWFTEEMDGLASEWYGSVWCNPPYGRGKIRLWVEKAVQEVKSGNCRSVVLLVPVATDTAWFHDSVFTNASKILLVRNRLYFESPDKKGRSSHASMVVIINNAGIGKFAPSVETLTLTPRMMGRES